MEKDIFSVWPEPFIPDHPALSGAKDDHPFGHASLELMKEVGIAALLISNIIPEEPMKRNDAIVCAFIVKSAKLAKAILAMTQDFGEERQLALFRELFEALAALNYLLEDEGNGERFDLFVSQSLASERANIETFKKNSKDRGYAQFIEKDMEKSIRKTAKFAGITDIDTIPGRKKIPWPSAEEMLFMISEYAYPAYRAGSGVIHTNWSDLLRNHLNPIGDGTFDVMVEERGPGPEPLYSGGLLLCTSLKKYLQMINPQAYEILGSKLDDLAKRIHDVAMLHNEFRNKQRGHTANQPE